MGCDIHSMVEVKRERYTGSGEGPVNGLPWTPGAGSSRWVALGDDDALFPNTYYDESSSYAPFRERLRTAPLDDRNYDLFALLADVRNGYGFAGTPRGDRIEPLSPPRGVPSDASYQWLAEVDSWDVDMHSHTWFTLAELIAFQEAGKFGQRMRRTGVIEGSVYEALKRDGGQPTGWSGGISGLGIHTLTTVEYDKWEADGKPALGLSDGDARLLELWSNTMEPDEIEKRRQLALGNERVYVQYVWEDTLDGSTRELESAITALKRYAADLPPAGETGDDGLPSDKPGWYGRGTIPHEHIRIVMGFDN